MYQETNGGNATKKQDLLLFFGLLALVIFARMLMNAVNSIPHGGILQIPLFIGLILICLMIYKKRLCSYRYTLFNMEPEEGDLDQYGNQRRNQKHIVNTINLAPNIRVHIAQQVIHEYDKNGQRQGLRIAAYVVRTSIYKHGFLLGFPTAWERQPEALSSITIL